MMKNPYTLFLTFILFSLVGCQSQDGTGLKTSADDERGEDFLQQEENSDRDSWQVPDRVIDQLGTLSGKTVADIGAGTGYFTFRLLPKAQKVIAVEIDERFINYLNNRKSKYPDSLANRLETRLADPEDPHLMSEEVDVVLVVNTYIYMSERIHYFRNLKQCIRPGGHIVVVDFKKKTMKVGPPLELRMAPNEVEAELLSAGYTNIRVDHSSLEYQYMIRAEIPE